MNKDLEYYESLPEPNYSVKHKRRINRLFRETVGSTKIPYPEVDNCYERTKSKFIIEFCNIKSKKR